MIGQHGTTFNETMQHYVDEYFDETGKDRATTKELAMWAIQTGRWEPPVDLVLRKCRDDFARAMREEYFKDEHGRPIRAKHAARMIEGDKQRTFWADMRRPTTTFNHMQVAFAQRREQIVGDCSQLSRDIDYYNGHHNPEGPIQLCFDFTDDVEESNFAGDYPVAPHVH